MKNIRLEATKYIWTAIAVIMGILFSSTFFMGQRIGVEHVVITVVLGIATFLSMGTVWNWGDVKFENEFVEQSSDEKMKRSRKLERMLKRLSDEDLEALRQHLTYEEEPYGIGDDGELIVMEQNT